MKLRTIAIAAVVALIAVAAAAGATHSGGNSLHTTLTGKAETPKGDPNGSGTAEVKITGKKVCWEIKATERRRRSTAAHIHKGGPGVAGPVVVPFGGAYKAKGCMATTASIAAAIKKNPGATTSTCTTRSTRAARCAASSAPRCDLPSRVCGASRGMVRDAPLARALSSARARRRREASPERRAGRTRARRLRGRSARSSAGTRPGRRRRTHATCDRRRCSSRRGRSR